MDRKPVKSSTIKSIGYHLETRVLEVEFLSGKVYRYADVSPEKHAEFIAAESIGKHFGKHIRPQHTAKVVESEKKDEPQ